MRARFSDFDYRTQSRSLKLFLHSLFGEELQIVGKHGPDDIFALIGPENVEGPSSDETAASAKCIDSNAWKLFINPSMGGFVFLDREKKRLFASDRVIPDPDLAQIERLSDQEQRAMMAEFSQLYSTREDAGAMRQAVESPAPDYWRQFYEATRRLGLTKRWLIFRRSKLETLLRERLVATGLEEHSIPKIPNDERTNVPAYPENANHTSSDKRLSSTNLSKLAQAAILHLSEEEIRALRLPLGAIFDALSDPR